MRWPIFIISLTDAHDRREAIRKQCDTFGLTFEFVDAVDGRQGLPPEMESKVDRAGSLSDLGRVLTDAEFACALSHQMIYERIVREKLPGAIVLEDDAILTEEFSKFIRNQGYLLADFIQMDYSYARYWPWKTKQFKGVKFRELAQNAVTATAYSLSLNAAQYILSQSRPLKGFADWPCDMMPLRPLATVPRLATQPAICLTHSTLEAGRLQSMAAAARSKPARWKRFGSASYWRRWVFKRTTRII